MQDELSYMAEQKIIGSLMLDGSSIEKVCGMIEPEMFTNDLYGRIYLECLRGYENNTEVTPVTIVQKLQSEQCPAKIIMQEINDCISGTVTSVSINGYATALLTDYKSRKAKEIVNTANLQLLRSDRTYGGNRTAEVGAISKAIKALAMELNIPIIALSQLNRRSEVGEVKEPTMAELREAGDIEQDASIIILMWNLSQTNRSKKGCKIEKNRQGQTGKVVLEFDGDMMQFKESDESVKDAASWAEQADDDCPFK